MPPDLTRRDFLAAAAGAAPLLAAGRGLWGAEPKRPNIIVVMADDMGYSDLGCYGSEICTPHLDRMARYGLRFSQFYNTPRCCPSRATLLTGLYPHQAGIGHMTGDYGLPGYRGRLNERCVTLAEALRGAGYRTLMSGKWHVGEQRPHWPTDRGFDRYFGLISGASNYWKVERGRKMAVDDKPYSPPSEGFYMTDAFSSHAVSFIEQHGRQQQPFFLYVAYTAPHWPLHAWPEDIDRYRGKYMMGWDALRQQRHQKLVRTGLIDSRWPLTPRDPGAPAWDTVKDKEAWALKMAVYAAQIDRMDQGIGRILAKVREVGQEDNTLVLFLVDNGGCAERVDRGKPGVPPGPADSFASYCLPWANASNTPFRLYKHWVHEGGIASPLVAYWPAGIARPGRIVHDVAHSMDIMATCLDLAGARYPSTYKGHDLWPLEGKGLTPLLKGGARPGHNALFWEHEGNRAVRRGQWKLVSRHGGQWELYDMAADRTELTDLAQAHPAKASELLALYQAWATRCNVVPWPPRGRRGRRKRTRPGMQLHLRFDEPEDAKQALDRTKGKRHLDYHGTTPATSEGVVRCRRFDGKADHLDMPAALTSKPAGFPIAVAAWVRPDSASGVIFVHGGSTSGYVLYLRDGKPVFLVRDGKEPAEAAGQTALPDGWVHLAGTLARDGAVRLFVNGTRVAAASAGAPITRNPGESIQVGADLASKAGAYPDDGFYRGLVAELKLAYEEWDEAKVAAEAARRPH